MLDTPREIGFSLTAFHSLANRTCAFARTRRSISGWTGRRRHRSDVSPKRLSSMQPATRGSHARSLWPSVARAFRSINIRFHFFKSMRLDGTGAMSPYVPGTARHSVKHTVFIHVNGHAQKGFQLWSRYLESSWRAMNRSQALRNASSLSPVVSKLDRSHRHRRRGEGGRHCFGSVHLDPVPCLL